MHLIQITAKNYNFPSIKGISQKQLEEHYKLYAGYVKKLNEIWNEQMNSAKFSSPNTTYGEPRNTKLGESYALNGVKLHELYFENLGGTGSKPSPELSNAMLRQFGSFDDFLMHLKNVGLSMRGWVTAVIDPLDGAIHVTGSDAHDAGSLWLSYPLIVLDVYEHAYFLDFGTDRKRYLDIVANDINWDVASKRFNDYLKIKACLMGKRSVSNLFPQWTLN